NLTVTAKWAVDRDSQENIDYLFIGDSIISTSFWYTYAGQFGGLNSVNLGVPGTQIPYWIEKLSTADILQYNPVNVVMHIGINDVNDGAASDETVIGRLTTLFAGLKEIYPEVNLYYISICHNALFPQNRAIYESVNAWVGERTNVTFLDVAQYITTDESGVAETQWFISDGLHLNENGYGLWNRALANEFGLPYTVTGGGLGETTVEGAPSYGYTGGWTYDADTQIWHFGETGPGISKLTISEAYGSTVYAEAKISIAGMYNGDQFGKAGIAVSSATATYFFYVNLSYGANSDGIYDDNYGSLAYCPEIRGAKNWVYPESDGGVFRPFGGNGYVHLGAEAYDYNVDPTAYKTLGVAKYGKSLYFFSSGSLVGKLENSLFGENEAVSVSVYNFNANMYAKAGSATTAAEEVDAILTPYVSLKTLDGSLADWTDAEKTNPVVIPSSNGRSVTVYASLDDRGVNIFYDIYHSAYAQDAANWWENTNVEFRLGADSTKQYFMTVKGERGGFPAGYMATTNDPSGLYHTVAELYVPYSAIEGNYSKDSAFIPSMFAYKTPGEGNPIWSQTDFWFSSNFEERVHLITRNGFLAAGEKTIDGNADDWAGATFTTSGRAEYATYLGEDGFYLYIRQTLDSIGGNRAFYGLDWWLNQNLEIQATENFGSGHVAFFNGKAYVFRGVTQAAATYTDGETSDTIVYELFISKYIMKGDTSETVIFSCGGQTFADNETTVNAWQTYASAVTVRVPSYTVTYSDGDASSTAYVRIGDAIGSLPAPAGAAGYTFDGWYVDGVKIDESYVPAGDVTVIAKYNPVLPEITFGANGGELKADASAPVVTPVWNEGEKCYTVVLPAECPYELADYEFEKWAVAAEGISGSTQYDPGATVVLAPGSKITVSVVWIAAGAKTYRVTFSLGYEGAPEYDETRTVEEGSAVTDFPVDPERSGYRFLGWYDESDRAFTEDTAVSANTALTAKWVRLVTVTYDLGYEGAGTAPAAATVDEGTCVTLPEPPVRAYYLFLGWFYGENNEFTAETAVTENLTVTAKWAVDRDSQENINYLFIGASTISTSYWYTYGGQFGSLNQAVNLAVPGTRVEYWIEKLSTADILQYNPVNIVMHIGMNNVNDGMESDETVIGRLTTLFAGFKEIYPDANLYYVSIIPNVAFSQNTATYQSVNNWAKAQEGISFIDVAQYITTGENGVPEMQWYASDGLHPGVDGYTIFHREIAVALGLPYTESGAGLGDTNVEGAPDYGHTAGWTYDADTQIWHNNDVGVMGVHKLMIDGAYGATLYAEAKVSVAGMYCGETVGKGGLAVSSPTATYFFFINLSYGANSDGIYDDNYGSLAYRPEIRGGKDWVYPEDASFRPFGGNGYVPLGAEAYDHNVDPTAYKTLGIAKVGSALYFYASGNLVGALNNSLFGKDEAVTVSVFNFNTDMYAKAGFATTAAEEIGAKVPSHEKTIDGSLADWSESDKTNPVVYPATNGRSVTVYATMGGDGVYIFYDVLHTEHVTTHAVTEWHLNTNVEFRLGSGGTQFFFTTNGFRNGIAIGDAVMITTQEGSMYHTVAEIFVPYTHADLAAYPADGEYVPAGFAFKVEGQDGALWASGNWWYVPEADPNNPNFIVTKNGIKTGSEKSIDGDLSDWADVSFTTSAGTKEGVTAQYAAYLGADGLYVAITVREASIDIGRTNTAGNWWTNTNIEMFATDNTYAARLVTFGGKLYYTGRISAAAQSFTDGDSEDVWTVEFFIANENLKNVTAETASIAVDFGGQLYGAVTDTWQDYARGITATRG
ncbi:MAG: InlB B-repeat-containing protein, partial [Candidatus Gallimonas sp.]